ncbi:dihydrofolate reductase family protein [Streptomyces sp. NPDC046716]|uniref:dihydrofolate reductase family protein n=1 Tax=Streptomyces sp. NPDC046716 TaxID=3157093 RepID=UPI0033C91931
MRKIVLMMGVSLDGYLEGPGREIDWHVMDAALHQHMNDVLRPMGGFLSGRVTHELMADYWPEADAGPDADPVEAEFAEIWREKPKIVFSRTLKPGPAPWHTTVLPEVSPAAVRALKEEPGGDLSLGGADLAATFLEHDLVDEFRIYIHPVLIGAGKRVFPDGPFAPSPLRLVETRAFDNGVVLMRYERVAE